MQCKKYLNLTEGVFDGSAQIIAIVRMNLILCCCNKTVLLIKQWGMSSSAQCKTYTNCTTFVKTYGYCQLGFLLKIYKGFYNIKPTIFLKHLCRWNIPLACLSWQFFWEINCITDLKTCETIDCMIDWKEVLLLYGTKVCKTKI